MRIGVNARFLISGRIDGFGRYSEEVIRRLVEAHPTDEFILFFDRPFDERFVFGKNVTPVVLGPPARHPLLFIVWFEWSIRRALKKYKVDLFIDDFSYGQENSYLKYYTEIIDELNNCGFIFEKFENNWEYIFKKYNKV